jgi:hypothetical protein
MHDDTPPIGVAGFIPEARAKDPEMLEILRSFAERHEEFLRSQECEPALPAVDASHRR